MNKISPQKDIVLIIDDNPTNLDVLSNYLDDDFDVLVAESGESALEQLQYCHPDIILLDIMMPGLNGFETCKRLKSQAETKNIPVIFMTALVDTADKIKGFKVGAVDYITKPLQHEEVMVRLNIHLTIHNLQKDFQAKNEHLQKSRERYRLLAQNSTDMISRQTLAGIYQYVSPACQTILGFEFTEMLGHAASEFVHPDDRQKFEETLQKQAAVSTITYRARCQDNSYIWLETTNRIMNDPETGQVSGIVAVSRNVSERKQAELALEKSLQQIERAKREWEITADSLSHLICLLDSQGYVMRANRIVEEWVPLQIVEVKGKNIHELLHPHCTVSNCYLALFWLKAKEILAQNQIIDYEVEDRVLNRYIHLQVQPVTTQIELKNKAETSFAVLIVNDITQRKQAEEALRESEERYRLIADRLQSRLIMAQQIQQGLLPPNQPDWPCLDVVCFSTPAQEVGGDFYTYHAFEDGRFAIAVGDVSGKGMPAALLMGISLAFFQSAVGQGFTPTELMVHLDQAIVPYTRTTRQNCALVYVEITPNLPNCTDCRDAQSHTLWVVNAACIDPLVRRNDGSVTWLETGGLPLGLGFGEQLGYQDETLTLNKGDLMILVSDGVIEAKNAIGDMFGFERLEQAVAAGPPHNAQAMLLHLKIIIEEFENGTAPHDDLTMVIIQA